jgi:sugar/nucleoside kinase (ribokinase family)/fructoselysine-6-P-deglycase FrlB-like protein
MKKHTATVIGLGNIVFDHGFLENEEGIKYVYSRGGGTIGNILINLAFDSVETAYVGYYETSTPYGIMALEELKASKVNIGLAQEKSNRSLQLYFQMNKQAYGQHNRNIFTSRCIVCDARADTRERFRANDYSQFIDIVEWKKVTVCVTDKLNLQMFRFVQTVKRKNPDLLAVLDLGHIANLRYLSPTTITKWIKAFDVVFIHKNVFDFICRQNVNLEKHLVFDTKGNNITTKLLIVTKDHHGLDYYLFTVDKTILKQSMSPAHLDDVICSAGAGDSLVSTFISEYVMHSISKSEFFDCATSVNKSLRIGIKTTSTVLKRFGARGHLPLPVQLSVPTEKYKRKSLGQIRKLLEKNSLCPFCMRSKFDHSPSKMSNIERLIRTFPKCMEGLKSADTAIASCKQILDIGNSYSVVGTGGSRAPANYITQLISQVTQKSTIFLNPYDYYRGLGTKTDWLVVVSYSGHTHDCGLAIQKARILGVKRVALITNSLKPKLSGLLYNVNKPGGDVIISYKAFCDTKEKSFISFAGSIVPSALFAIASRVVSTIIDLKALQKTTERQAHVTNTMEQFIKQIARSRNIEIFGGGYAWPAILDLESKLTEGNVCSVQIHESKDFSHGRFMLSMNNPSSEYPKLILQVGKNQYEDLLFRVLSEKSGKNKVVYIQSRDNGLIGGLELLIRIQLFTLHLAEIMYKDGKDITKPDLIPKRGLELYRWKE